MNFIKGFQHFSNNESQFAGIQLVGCFFYFLKNFDIDGHNSTFEQQLIGTK